METKKVIKKMILITIFSLIIIFLLQFIYLVPENHYTITDQTQEIILEDYPELKEVSFMYSTDLLIEFYKKRDNLELEKINFRFNDEIIGTVEINRNINDLENFGQTYIDIYIKDLKTNKTFVINRNNIFLEFERGGPKVFLPSI